MIYKIQRKILSFFLTATTSYYLIHESSGTFHVTAKIAAYKPVIPVDMHLLIVCSRTATVEYAISAALSSAVTASDKPHSLRAMAAVIGLRAHPCHCFLLFLVYPASDLN
jgi:hypothetical protein